MLTIYKKVEKEINNPKGILEIDDFNSLDKPFLLAISGLLNHDQSIFGMLRSGAQAARVHTSQDDTALFKINDMPLDFLGLRFKPDDNYSNVSEEIVERFIYPYLTNDGSKNVESLKKRANNINIMTYCSGVYTYERIEKKLISRLEQDGYTTEDIDSIVSNISLFALANAFIPDAKAQSISFFDINDLEVSNTKIQSSVHDIFVKNNISSFYSSNYKNGLVFGYEGTGKHNLKTFFNSQSIIKPVVSSVVSLSLEKKINSDTVTIQDYEEILKRFADDNKSVEAAMDELDEVLSYNKAPKYSHSELQLRNDFDSAMEVIYNERKESSKRISELENQNSHLQQKSEYYENKYNELYSLTLERGLFDSGEDNNYNNNNNENTGNNASTYF